MHHSQSLSQILFKLPATFQMKELSTKIISLRQVQVMFSESFVLFHEHINENVYKFHMFREQ